jgi:hypothetical protein
VKRYIVGPVYDWVFFLLPPLASLLVGIALSGTFLASDDYVFNGEIDTLSGFAIGAIIHAHLVAVVFRSHGNPAIRRLYPIRFIVVPIALWLAIVLSPWLAAATTVVATFWDVWHSGAQTFGFGRIYERNHGTRPDVGRRLDFWLNQVLYAGPVLAGVTLADHVASFDSFKDVGVAVFTSVPARVDAAHRTIAWAVLALGAGFIAFYVLSYVRLARQGYRPSWLKIWLTASTALVSIYTWGFNSWGQAFLIMNLFHGVQYLALVWAMEGKRIARRPAAALALFLGSVLAYGVAVQAISADLPALWAITMVVSLMHFWYDAFVWSVRRAQV